MNTTFVTDHMRETMRALQLVPHVVLPPKMEAYWLRRSDGRRASSSLLVFTPEGIAIMGDLTPGVNGALSVLGYGREWFAGNLSEDYLCSKFLRREWLPQKGAEQLRDEVLRLRRDGSLEKEVAREAIDELNSVLRDGDLQAHDAYDIWTRAGLYDFEIGIGYEPRDAGWLCAIQQRFAELYAAFANERAA